MGLLIFTTAAAAGQENHVISGPPAQEVRDLYLEVFFNDVSTGLIGNFKQLSDGGLLATEEELMEIGLKSAPTALFSDGLVRIDWLSDIVFRVEEPTQRLYMTLHDDARVSKIIDLDAPGQDDSRRPRSSRGIVLNYTLFGISNSLFEERAGLINGGSGAFDARFFSPYGVLNQSFITSYSSGSPLDGVTRLNTTWSYSNHDSLISYRAGDVISGSLPWTRSVHLGGFQIQRNFELRPDLITMPLPSFAGAAAIPSTLEVYSQNARTYSGSVAPGPFQLINIPVFTGAGKARVVLRDSLGRETIASLPFYTSNTLLRKGLLDFSAEIGYLRRNFGIKSQDYDDRIMGAVTVRHGLTDKVTVEGHLEGSGRFFNGGLGLAFPVGAFGVGSFAVAHSHHAGAAGSLANASFEMRHGQWSLYGTTQRTFGQYEDIASISAHARLKPGRFSAFDAGPARALDQLALTVPSPFGVSSFTLSYAKIKGSDRRRNRMAGVSYSQPILRQSTFSLTVFKNLDMREGIGFFMGISIPIGNRINTTMAVEKRSRGMGFTSDVISNERQEEGSGGWRLRVSKGRTVNSSVMGSYRASVARFEGRVEQYDDSIRMTGQIDGAVVVAGGGVFATNRIDDAFAIVDVGVPDVDVQHQNRRVGSSNRHGRIVVPGLLSYKANTISIDPSKLPVDIDIASTKKVVIPADRSGVMVDFGINIQSNAALVGFVDDHGAALDVGLRGRLVDGSETFVIGYDGEAYIRSLSSYNTVEIERVNGGSCRAGFHFTPGLGRQVTIKNIPCL